MFGNLKEFQKPVGEYIVGITEMDFLDLSRIGVYEISKGEPREIPVIIYYPADSSEGKPSTPYVIDEIAEHCEKATKGIVSRKSMQNIKTHCYKDVKISSKKALYPVIFFNHGYLSYQAQNTVLCSDLASKGYIVISPGHPYETMAVKFQDGRIIKLHEFFQNVSNTTVNKEVKKINSTFMKTKYADEEILPLMTEYLEQHFKGTVGWNNIKIWADDTRFVADQLDKINDGSIPSIFEGKLDLKLGFGITGQSYGGCTATQVCLDDPRFKCGINMDGPTYSDYWDKDVKKPFMVLGSAWADATARTTFLYNSEDSYLVIIAGTEHQDYSDIIFFARQLQLLGLIGKRDMNFFRDVVTKYHLDFFEKYLKGSTEAKFLDLKYEDVKFRSRIKEPVK